MAAAGRVLLILGLLCAVYGIVASIYGARTGRRELVDSGRRAMYSLAGISIVAFVILDVAFITSDFSYTVVADGSSTTTPFLYRLAAIWATQQGSLLLWVMLLSIWSSLALFLTRHKVSEIVPYAQATLLALGTFFTGLIVFFANPFATTANPPTEGAGLDPLLRHTTMMVHPPMLYSGYTLLMVPFAFAVGALISGRLNAEWIQVTRRFALGAWLCLGIGVMLGARWSYIELGWGGFWAWDPVENAALMPWLVATAYIHSIMIQEKRGMLKVWNVSLILLTGTLAIVGDFLVRSGILSSIHAFVSDPTLNIAFVALISVIAIGSIGLVVWRRQSLHTEARLDSTFSREGVFLLQNLVLVALAAVIFWFTFFPLISEAITGTLVSVGPPVFDRFVAPLALVVVGLSGIGPIIPWRRVTPGKLRRNFAFPVAAAVLTLVVVLNVSGVTDHLAALLMFCFGAFVVATVVQELFRGARARRAMTAEPGPLALARLVRRNRRRYGGYTIHMGVALALIGVAASTSFQHQRDAVLRPGQSVTNDGYTFRYVRPTASATAQKISLGAWLDVSKHGRHVTTVHTSYGLYPSQDPAHPIGRFFDGSHESTVGLDPGFTRDIWTVIDPSAGARATAAAHQRGRRQAEQSAELGGLPAPGPAADVPQLHLRRARSAHPGADPAVHHPPVAGPVPAGGLAAGHVVLAGRDPGRGRRADRAVAAAATPPPPAPAAPGARRRSRRAGDPADGAGARARARLEAGPGAVAYLIVLVVLAGAVYVISGPLRAARRGTDPRADDIAELEAARDAKYQEIREAELDLRTGKLSDDDYQAIDQTLRTEAMEILRRLDRANDGQQVPSGSPVTVVLDLVQVADLRRTGLPDPHALGQGRRPVRCAFGVGTRRRPARRRLTRGAQPQPLDDRLRRAVPDQHDRADQDVLTWSHENVSTPAAIVAMRRQMAGQS